MTTSKWDQLEGNDVDGEPLQDDQEGGQGGKVSRDKCVNAKRNDKGLCVWRWAVGTLV